jgi:hypothetical protein
LGCVTAAAWHWRHDLRDWAVKFSHQSSATQTEQVSNSASPISTSGSAAAPNGQSITDNPTTESPTQPGGGLQPAGTAAEQRNTLAEAQPIQQPIAAQPGIKRRLAETSQPQDPRRRKGSLRLERALSLNVRRRSRQALPRGQKRQLLPLAAQTMHSRPRVKVISTELSLPQTARVRREICSPRPNARMQRARACWEPCMQQATASHAIFL